VRARTVRLFYSADSPEMTHFPRTRNVGPCTALARSPLHARPLVLIVEDDEDTRFLLRTLLERRGLRVVEAEDGVSGVRAAEELRPDLILMDWSMPGMDGLNAMRLIRARDSWSETPVIIISGHASPASRELALANGCSEYLVKPLDFDQLDRALRKHLLLRMVKMSLGQEQISERVSRE
jgi:two-component system, cell cycle response regulator DivK